MCDYSDYSDNEKIVISDRELRSAVADAMRSHRREEIYTDKGLEIITKTGRRIVVKNAKPEPIQDSNKKIYWYHYLVAHIFYFFSRPVKFF